MNFLFTTFIQYEVFYQVDFLEQTFLKKSADY